MSQIQFPFLGNSLVMAVVILAHVFLAFIAVGGVLIAFVSECISYTKNSPNHNRIAKKYMDLLSSLMKIGGPLGTIIVVLLIGLFPDFTKKLFNIFFYPFLVEGVMFFILFAASIYYRETWDNTKNKKLHLFSGFVAASAAVFAAFIINAIWAFMLTPGDYFINSGSSSAFLNPLTFTSFTHLIIPCVINGAFFFYLYSHYKIKIAVQGEQDFYRWARSYTGKITAVFILLQPISGLLFLLKIRNVDISIFNKIVNGDVSVFFYPMVALAIIAAISSCIFLLSKKRAYTVMLIGGLAALLAFPLGGYTRERARKPYLIHGYMYMNQKLASPEKAEGKETVRKNLLADYGCLSCHKFHGEGGTFAPELTNVRLKYTKEQIENILKNPPTNMPPFSGNQKEMEEVIEFLLSSGKQEN